MSFTAYPRRHSCFSVHWKVPCILVYALFLRYSKTGDNINGVLCAIEEGARQCSKAKQKVHGKAAMQRGGKFGFSMFVAMKWGSKAIRRAEGTQQGSKSAWRGSVTMQWGSAVSRGHKGSVASFSVSSMHKSGCFSERIRLLFYY